MESDGEIEYLEEDEDIVQQCVQITQDVVPPAAPVPPTPPPPEANKLPLLVERPQVEKKKKRRLSADDSDSDYDPSEDIIQSPPSPPSPIRKRKPPPKKPKTSIAPASVNIVPNIRMVKKEFINTNVAKVPQISREKMNIRIPDYEDPLCLPVRAVKTHDTDKLRLDNWNKVCLEHFKHCDTMLKPEVGGTLGSVRTAVFKNIVNKETGNYETTIWSKTSVENKDGDRKSEIFQCVLPRYREKKILNEYLFSSKKTFNINVSDQVLLCKEDHNDGEALVVYKPSESLSAVYGLIDARSKDDENSSPTDESKMYLKELTTAKICAPCFQTSWRGIDKIRKKPLVCPICGRTYSGARQFSSPHTLLAHVKTHTALEVNRNKEAISKLLAEVIGYHYKCRICRRDFESIKILRKHVFHHQNTNEQFTCEIGNHVVNPSHVSHGTLKTVVAKK